MKIGIKSNDFTSSELKFLLLLEEDAEFENYIKIRRLSALNMPPEGFETSGSFLNPEYDFEAFNFELLIEESIKLTKAYNLPESWVLTFNSILLCNEAVAPDRSREISIEREGNCLNIKISINTSCRNIKKFIDENNNKIKLLLKSLPESPKIKSDIRSIRRGKDLLSYRVKKSESKKFFEANPNFEKNYKLSECDYDILGVYKRRAKEIVKRVSQKDWRSVIAYMREKELRK